jgi:hypothetical protein
MKIGLFGSCQLCIPYKFFFSNEILKIYNFEILFALFFFNYDDEYTKKNCILDYAIFDNCDILIIENNNLQNQASSTKIIEYCLIKNKNMKIIKTFLINFPIFPLNWSRGKP